MKNFLYYMIYIGLFVPISVAQHREETTYSCCNNYGVCDLRLFNSKSECDLQCGSLGTTLGSCQITEKRHALRRPRRTGVRYICCNAYGSCDPRVYTSKDECISNCWPLMSCKVERPQPRIATYSD